MVDFYPLIRPLMFALEPEKAHGVTLNLMKCGLFPKAKTVHDSALEQVLWGIKFPNPVGLSAGFDKNAEVVGPAFNLGFGFVEAGTVTPKPQDGNPKPRIFRDPSNDAVINRMGFPNGGMGVFKENLEKFLASKNKPQGVLGINIGMNKTQSVPIKDYSSLIKMLAPMADYLTINISSPNTPGLRDLQKREPLLELLMAVKDARAKACRNHAPPLLVKFAPDLDDAQIEELAFTVLEGQIEGVILTNTTLDRPEYLPDSFRSQAGGLSGAPVRDKSTNVIRKFYQITEGKLPIIGVGGISNAEHAYEKIKAGASLVQLYTGLIFKGPMIAQRINEDLLQLLARDGYASVSQAIGVEANGE